MVWKKRNKIYIGELGYYGFWLIVVFEIMFCILFVNVFFYNSFGVFYLDFMFVFGL